MNAHRATIVASFPPPMVGQALVTQKIADALADKGRVACFDWLPNLSYGLGQRCQKAALSVVAPCWVVWQGLRGHRQLYSVANAGWGLYYNLALQIVARICGFRTTLHHHGISYLNPNSRALRWIDQWMGPNDVHVVLGDEMRCMLQPLCREGRRIEVVMNGFMVDDLDTSESAHANHDTCRVMGHLSNLCIGKGIDLVLDTFRELNSQLPHTHLVLAGPCFDVEAKRLVDQARDEFGSKFKYLGAVYGANKEEFFRQIDTFIYPTRDDAQPLVALESLAYGVPVIATPVGCLPSLLQSPDWIAPKIGMFVQHAVAQIRHWHDDGASFDAARHRSRLTAQRVRESSAAQLKQLVDTIMGTGSQGA